MILDSILNMGEHDIGVNASTTVNTADANTIQIDSVLDYFGTAIGNDVGRGGDIMLNVRVTSENIVAAAASSAVVDIALKEHTAGTSIASGTTVATYTVAGMNTASSAPSYTKMGGYLLRVKVPPTLWGDATEKYLGLSITPKGQNLSAGKVTAWLGMADDDLVVG